MTSHAVRPPATARSRFVLAEVPNLTLACAWEMGANDLAVDANELGRSRRTATRRTGAGYRRGCISRLGFPHATVFGTEIEKLTDGVGEVRVGLAAMSETFLNQCSDFSGQQARWTIVQHGRRSGRNCCGKRPRSSNGPATRPKTSSYALKLAHPQLLLDSAHQLRNPPSAPVTDTLVNLTKRLQNSAAIVA